jgi:uncharacterized membrane-anchored protein
MNPHYVLAKVPAVTLTFWIIKILATTLGETGGDALSMTMSPGYLLSTGIFATALIILIILQVAAKQFHPLLYWATIVASTTAGTTLADFATRSIGIGYVGGSLLLFALVFGSLTAWYWSEGTVSVQTVNTPRVEWFYWITITFSQTLGTALGDWVAAPMDDIPPGMGFGYEMGALIFGSALAIVAALCFWSRISHVLLFWTAFIITRPLGATIGDFFDKPIAQGGLNISRPLATVILAAIILVCIFIFPQRAGEHPGAAKT